MPLARFAVGRFVAGWFGGWCCRWRGLLLVGFVVGEVRCVADWFVGGWRCRWQGLLLVLWLVLPPAWFVVLLIGLLAVGLDVGTVCCWLVLSLARSWWLALSWARFVGWFCRWRGLLCCGGWCCRWQGLQWFCGWWLRLRFTGL